MNKLRSQEETLRTLFESARNAVCLRETVSDIWSVPSPVWFFREDPRKFVRDYMRKVDRLVLNQLVYLTKIYKRVFVSQSRIARSIGYTREEVCRSVRRLRAYGLLRVIYRHWQPSIYIISSLFSLKRVIDKIGSFITSLYMGYRKNLTQLSYLVNSKLNSNRISIGKCRLTCNSKNASRKEDVFSNWESWYTCYLPKEWRGRFMTKEEAGKRVNAVEGVGKTLDLTSYGKAFLSIYDPSILIEAHTKLLKALKKGTSIPEPFNYLVKICKDESQARKIPVNWSLFNACKDRYQFSEEEEPLNSKKVTFKHDPPLKSVRCNKRIPKQFKHIESDYDKVREEEGYAKIEQSSDFKRNCSFLGEEIMRNLLNRCKENVLAKAH